MLSQWEVECEFNNGFMQQDGLKCKIRVTAAEESDAKHRACLKMCETIGISTMFHTGVKVLSIKSTGRV